MARRIVPGCLLTLLLCCLMCGCDHRSYDLQVKDTAGHLSTAHVVLDTDNLKQLNLTEGDMERVVAQLDNKGEVS